MDSIIIACGGNGTRWAKSSVETLLPPDKCRLRVNGEAIMDRTSRELAKRFGSDSLVSIVTNETSYKLDFNTISPEVVTGTDVDKFLSSSSVWSKDGKTVIAFGDVWMSDDCLDTVAKEASNSVRWFGRRKASKCTGKGYGEIWAVSFGFGAAKQFEEACLSTALQFKLGKRRRAIGWDVFEVLSGKPACCPDVSFVDVDDWTEDFDCLEDWENWNKKSCVVRRWSK